MPNYRYNSQDYMRRGNYTRQMRATSPASIDSQNTRQSCCDDREEYDELKGMALAMAYVPWQEWRNLYESEKGFKRGTIFMDLDKPFTGKGGCCK